MQNMIVSVVFFFWLNSDMFYEILCKLRLAELSMPVCVCVLESVRLRSDRLHPRQRRLTGEKTERVCMCKCV